MMVLYIWCCGSRLSNYQLLRWMLLPFTHIIHIIAHSVGCSPPQAIPNISSIMFSLPDVPPNTTTFSPVDYTATPSHSIDYEQHTVPVPSHEMKGGNDIAHHTTARYEDEADEADYNHVTKVETIAESYVAPYIRDPTQCKIVDKSVNDNTLADRPLYPIHPCIQATTIVQIPNFLETHPHSLAVAGNQTDLSILKADVFNGNKVRREHSLGPYHGYIPLQDALRQVCLQSGVECPSLAGLCHLHRNSTEYQDYLEIMSVLTQKKVITHPNKLDLTSISAIIDLLSLEHETRTGRHTRYQLGIISLEEQVVYARIHPFTMPAATGTVWMLYDPYWTRWEKWFGLCSDDAYFTGSSIPSTRVQAKEKDTEIPEPHRQNRQLDPIARSKKRKTVTDQDNAHSQDDRPRKVRATASQIRDLREELPSHYTPNQILDQVETNEPHYNNLLRVAIWFSNKDIFDRLNAARRLRGKGPYKALSAITKRIGVACKYFAQMHGLPIYLLRGAFNNLRTANNISTRENGSFAFTEQTVWWQDRVNAALNMLHSSSPDAGLVHPRDMSPSTPRMRSMSRLGCEEQVYRDPVDVPSYASDGAPVNFSSPNTASVNSTPSLPHAYLYRTSSLTEQFNPYTPCPPSGSCGPGRLSDDESPFRSETPPLARSNEVRSTTQTPMLEFVDTPMIYHEPRSDFSEQMWHMEQDIETVDGKYGGLDFNFTSSCDPDLNVQDADYDDIRFGASGDIMG